MKKWNSFCIEKRLFFLPVVLQNLVGYVGPLVNPGITACFECLRARQNANISQPDEERLTEYHAHAGRFVAAFHPLVASTVADIAAFELTKFLGELHPVSKVAHLIEINLLTSTMRARKILRIPRCSACSPFLRQTSVSITKDLFVGLNDEVESIQ